MDLIGAHDVVFDGDVKPRASYFDEIWSLIDLELDSRVVADDSGSLIAYGHVFVMSEGGRADVLGRVRPDSMGAGLGSRLLSWTERRAVDRGAASVRQMLPVGDLEGAALLSSHGYRHARTWWEMMRSTTDPDEAGAPPAGVEVRGFRDGDGPVLHRILQETAADVPGSSRQPYRAWQRAWLGSPLWDPTLVWFASVDGQVIAALAACSVKEGGYVSQLGTLTSHRGRGIARHLLRLSFEEFARRGVPEVSLHVDSANPTGATTLYSDVGMHARRTLHLFEKSLAA